MTSKRRVFLQASLKFMLIISEDPLSFSLIHRAPRPIGLGMVRPRFDPIDNDLWDVGIWREIQQKVNHADHILDSYH
jgi:hypothetical protein